MNWQVLPLGETCEIVMGQAPSGETYNTQNEGLPLIAGAGDFKNGIINPNKFTTAPTKLSKANDIIISIRASIGDKVWSDSVYCLGRGVAAIRPNPSIYKRFLWHTLTNLEKDLAAKGKGATFLQVNKEDISSLKIPLPPLPEQKRIAAILDKADEIRRKRETAIAKLDQLAQSIFLEMFGNPVANEKGWERKKIVDIGKVVIGNTPPRKNLDNYGNAIEWIKSDNLNTPHYYLTKAAEGLSETGKKIARTAPVGAILITCIAGSADCIGNAAMADREVAFNQQINAFIPENGNSHFYYGQFIVGKQLVQNASTASMKGMVSKGRFEQIEMVVPPLDLQEEFANRISKLEMLKADSFEALAKQNNLFSSLQHAAFSGQL